MASFKVPFEHLLGKTEKKIIRIASFWAKIHIQDVLNTKQEF
jgi:hypothetical protein